jgi:aspartate-semialdehyde dehydrogenase
MHDERELAIAIVGATGLVGREIAGLLRERRFPVASLRALGSLRSAGAEVEDDEGGSTKVALLGPESFDGIDIALFACGPGLAGQEAPRAVASGAAVIDCSSRFRFDPAVPLVVPEVNPAALADRRERGIVAIPSATTIGLAVALAPLAEAAGLRRVIVSTYQGVASAGQGALRAFSQETIDLLNQRGQRRSRFARPLAFNCLPQVGALLSGDATSHEAQVIEEARRVLDLSGLPMFVTAVRVPMFFGSAMSVVLETDSPLDAREATGLLRTGRGVVVHETPEGPFPTPAEVTGSDATHVGRIRADPTTENGLALWIALDSVRKGAALTAVQVAEILARDYL